jgi:hypothetical protein
LYQNCLAQPAQDLSRACGDRPVAVRAKVVAPKSAKNGKIFEMIQLFFVSGKKRNQNKYFSFFFCKNKKNKSCYSGT